MYVGICKVDDSNKVLMEVTKHVFPTYTFCTQKRMLHRYLVKPRDIKQRSFNSRLQDLSIFLGEYHPDTQDKILLLLEWIKSWIYYIICPQHGKTR